MSIKIEWFGENDFPDELSQSQNNLTVDVLVYCKIGRVRTVGWYNYNLFTWHFLSNENIKEGFKWRYFVDEIDKPQKKKKEA